MKSRKCSFCNFRKPHRIGFEIGKYYFIACKKCEDQLKLYVKKINKIDSYLQNRDKRIKDLEDGIDERGSKD